jgi:undecaprenyl-diphosphatase
MDRVGEWVEDRQRELPALNVSNWIIAGLLAVVMPLSFVAAGTSVLPGDVAITRSVQSWMPGVFEPLIAAANIIGEAPFMLSTVLVICIILLARGHWRQSLLVAAASLAQVANIALKLTLESPRPSSGLVHVSEQTSGFGFPSGHTMGTTVLALVLFYVATALMADGLRRRLVQAGLLLTPLLMGIARIDSGAHWPSDVLGAWLWGALAAIAIIMLSQRSWSVGSLPVGRPARATKRAIVMSDMSGD